MIGKWNELSLALIPLDLSAASGDVFADIARR